MVENRLSEPEPSQAAAPDLPRWFQWLLAAGCGVFAVLLGILVWIGSTARFLQDDYCFSVVLAQKNLIDIYLHETTFSGNRFMLVLTSALSEWLGTWSVRILPGFLLVMWVVGITLALRQIWLWRLPAKRWSSQNIGWVCLLVAEILVFFSLYTTPNLIQVFYWRAGSLTYLAPLVVFSYLAALMVWQLRQPRISFQGIAGIFLLAFAAAGYCETAAVFQLGVLGLATAGVLVRLVYLHQPVHGKGWLFAAAWIGTAAAVVILLSSPANAPRFAGSYQASPDIVRGMLGALDGAFYFTKLTFYWLSASVLFIGAFFTLFSFVVQGAFKIPLMPARNLWIWGIGVGVVAYLSIAAAMFPSYFIESSYPADRALLTPRWMVILGLASFGWLFGSLLRYITQKSGLNGIASAVGLLTAGVLTAGVFVLPEIGTRESSIPEIRGFISAHLPTTAIFFLLLIAGAAFLVFGKVRWPGFANAALLCCVVILWIHPAAAGWRMSLDLPGLSARAILWDRRDAQIRQMAANGQKEITVGALDSLAGIGELHADNNFWVNRCAAWYYQVDTLRAVEPVLKLP